MKILALLVLLAVQYSQAKVEPLECLPPELQSYLDDCHSVGDLRNQSGQIVFWTSINLYVSKFAQSVSNMTIAETKVFESALYEIVHPLLEPPSRRKRQASGTRIRQEVRTMTFSQRSNYFAAVNAMKNDRRLPPNVYDFLARLHSGENVNRAHRGPAFPGWHRLYLYIYESILRLWYDPSVTIPVWASVLDNEMSALTRTQSVIFSPEFYGNGDGIVRTGPFGNWRFLPGEPLTRNIGGTDQLMSYTAVERILTRTRNVEIFAPLARSEYNLENEHGLPHVFVGGTMNILNTAAFDPLFFSHHAFIDYIWERFRLQQWQRGINPETDYPFDVNDPRFRRSHHPNANAGFSSVDSVTVLGIQLGNLVQRVGYSNNFFSLVQYRDIPVCPNCDNSPFLYCERSTGRCVSRTRSMAFLSTNTLSSPQASSGMRDATVPSQQSSSGNGGSALSSTPSDSSITSHRNQYSNNDDRCERHQFIKDVDTRQMRGSDNWAYIPVNVVSKRPPSMKGFQKFSLYKSFTKWTYQAVLGHKFELMQEGWQNKYEECNKRQDAMGKISIISWGLNYDGYAEEYVIIDNRYGVSQANGYLPVKKPSAYNPSDFVTVAYDSCGRVCKPYCNNKNHGHVNNNFGGGFRVSIDSPKQYSNSYEEAMLGMWEMTSPSYSPVIDYGDIPITFFCEYTNKWIWDKPRPQPQPPQPQPPQPQPQPRQPHPQVPQPQPNVSQPYPNVRQPHQHVPQPHPHAPQPQPHVSQPHPHVPQPHVSQPHPHVPQPYQDVPQKYQHVPQPQPHVRQPQPRPPQSQLYPQPPTKPTVIYYHIYTNDEPGVEVQNPQAPDRGIGGQSCVVNTECTLDGPCKECTDNDYEVCRGGEKIAICIEGRFSIRT